MQDIAGDVQADTTLGRIRPGREAAGTGKATDTAAGTNPIAVARDGAFGKSCGSSRFDKRSNSACGRSRCVYSGRIESENGPPADKERDIGRKGLK